VRLPAIGDVIEVQAGYRAEADDALRRIIALTGPVAPVPERTLVNGYDSWSYAGVRAASDSADSYWGATLTTSAGALAFQALTSERFTTRVVGHAVTVLVASEPTPTHDLVDGTWGHENVPSETTVAVAAGEEVVSEPVAITAHADPLVATETVAALLPRRAWSGPPALGWESWYHYATRISTGRLLENARLLRERFGDRPGFDLFQIDDGWQEANGAWWPRERFPDDFGRGDPPARPPVRPVARAVHGGARRARARNGPRGLVRRRRVVGRDAAGPARSLGARRLAPRRPRPSPPPRRDRADLGRGHGEARLPLPGGAGGPAS
jgi:hypothetical protein